MDHDTSVINPDDKLIKCKPCRLDYLIFLFAFSFLIFFSFLSQDENRVSSSIFKYTVSNERKSELKKTAMIPGSRWIVVTTVQYPTEDIKYLASQGWKIVVVADMKTPADWNSPGVHFLSLENQQFFFGAFSSMIPYHSYTRKNLGYLYAIMNGAEWIYDTDDDNKPYGLGLYQFDRSSPISGLRYVPKADNISERLFNPYRFYGHKDMWPRGFPLDYLKEHTNGMDRMVSCREMPIPAVQQGVVNTDPDVDAIYRLLRAEKGSGLNVTFSNKAPSIVLEQGTYSPWNSQNTLFHYKAFFILYLPSSVSFRATDIWRSYFGQKLLHLIGENIAFYPANAVQARNAHKYLADFEQEVDVYKKSGKIVEFLDTWNCSYEQTVDCVKDLANEFVVNQFFKQSEKNLIDAWLGQLVHLGYNFPPLVTNAPKLNMSEDGNRFGNCRNANLDLGAGEYKDEKTKKLNWASQTVNGFGEILNWCNEVTQDNNTHLPSSKEFLDRYQTISGLQSKRNTVLVFLSNQDWRPAIVGLLQRIYSPFFSTTIFCGTWTDPSSVNGTLPPIRPLNFVNITPDEMRNGFGYNYCVSKINELRLQNVKGYYFMADDATFNIWNNLPMDDFVNPYEIDNGTFWWRPENINKSYELFERKYNDHPKIGKSWREHQAAQSLLYPGTNITDRYLNYPRKSLADFSYIPSKLMEISGNLMEVMTEAGVFSEVSFGLVQDGLNYNRGKAFEFKYLSGPAAFVLYNETLMGLHALKLGSMHTPEGKESRKQFCKTIIKTFAKKIYGQADFAVPPVPASSMQNQGVVNRVPPIPAGLAIQPGPIASVQRKQQTVGQAMLKVRSRSEIPYRKMPNRHRPSR